MFSLFMAVICSSSIAIIFKYSEDKKLNRYAVTTVNYVTAVIVSIITVMVNDSTFTNWQVGISIAIPTGIVYFYSYLFYQYSVRDSGAGLASMFSKLSVLFPMTAAILVWHEYPSSVQNIGILLALIAIIVVGTDAQIDFKRIKGNILGLFIFGGFASLSSKIFQKYGLIEDKSYYLMVLFFVAFLVSAVSTYRHGKKITRDDILVGMAVGVPNLFSSYFTIKALGILPSVIVFPVKNAASLALVAVLSRLIYKERLSFKSKIAVILTILSLVFMNIK